MPSIQSVWNPKCIIVQWVGIGTHTHTITHYNNAELMSLVKMALDMQQQITIAAWAITSHNDREAIRWARCDFNIALQPSTVGKWRK